MSSKAPPNIGTQKTEADFKEGMRLTKKKKKYKNKKSPTPLLWLLKVNSVANDTEILILSYTFRVT
jgi:hypothetical protein